MDYPAAADALQEAQAAAVSRLGIIPLYDEFTIAAARAGIGYTPRIDQQIVATSAVPEKWKP